MTYIDPEIIRKAVFYARDVMQGMGYNGNHGSIHLMDLKLQTNTITSILHNLIGYQISRLSTVWTFHPRGGNTADLTDDRTGIGYSKIQIKVTSDDKIKGNRISFNEGYFICVKYYREQYNVLIKQILAGEIMNDGWTRNEKTQLAILKPEAEKKLRKIWNSEVLEGAISE